MFQKKRGTLGRRLEQRTGKEPLQQQGLLTFSEGRLEEILSLHAVSLFWNKACAQRARNMRERSERNVSSIYIYIERTVADKQSALPTRSFQSAVQALSLQTE